MRQDDAGIGKQPAPVAGVMAALAQIDDQVDQVAAARAEEQRRPVGRDARTVRGDQEVGLEQAVLVPLAQLAQPAEPTSSPISIRSLTLKPRGWPRSASTAASAAMLIECWPLLSAVPRPYMRSPSTVSDQGERPGAPQLVETADGVAVAVDQDGQQRGSSMRSATRNGRSPARIVEDVAVKAERREDGAISSSR